MHRFLSSLITFHVYWSHHNKKQNEFDAWKPTIHFQMSLVLTCWNFFTFNLFLESSKSLRARDLGGSLKARIPAGNYTQGSIWSLAYFNVYMNNSFCACQTGEHVNDLKVVEKEACNSLKALVSHATKEEYSQRDSKHPFHSFFRRSLFYLWSTSCRWRHLVAHPLFSLNNWFWQIYFCELRMAFTQV